MVHELTEDAEHLLLVELILERLAGSAFLDAVEAGEVALVGHLPGDIKRRSEIRRFGMARFARGSRRFTRGHGCLPGHGISPAPGPFRACPR